MIAAAPPDHGPPDHGTVLGGLPYAVILLQDGDMIRYVNVAGEQFFRVGAAHLHGRRLSELLPGDSPIFSLIAQVLATGAGVAEYEVTVDLPRSGARLLDIQAAPIYGGSVSSPYMVLSLHEQSIARKIDRQLVHRGSARSMAAMAAMLAHEVKNPLSGIRGAAQLLERSADDDDRDLTRLIQDEVDRICALVDRMGSFGENGPPKRAAVNIHEVLDYVCRLARGGFARHAKITETYDPSLPAVYGNRDELIQVFLNLLKNAAEAVPATGGEIAIGTAFRHGIKMTVRGSNERVQLPLMITIQDNGSGIPDDLVPYLFDPFVTTKAGGSGLGLALVAKVIDDHGGVVELDNQPRRTVFRVMLPMMGKEPVDNGGSDT